MRFLLLIALMWINYEPIREVGNLGPVISDIESHLPSGQQYRDDDRITWTHEGTHGINSLLREKYGCPCFYVLDDGVARIEEPKTTLAKIAESIPVQFRGEVYNLYLVRAQSDWNEQPSYILDKWSAYTNGSFARMKLGIKNRQETVRYMMEFCVYASYLVYASRDENLLKFYKWQYARCLAIYAESGVKCPVYDEFALSKLRTKLNIRVIMFSASWCKYCKEARKTLIELEKVGVIVEEIDVDENPDAAKANDITSLPTFFVMIEGKTIVFVRIEALRKFFGMK